MRGRFPHQRRMPVNRRAGIQIAVVVCAATTVFSSWLGAAAPEAATRTRPAKNRPLNYQCDLTEPFSSFAIDGATMLWIGPASTSARRYLLGSLNRSPDGRFAAQTVQGPKDLKTFVITSDVGGDGMSDRTYGSTLEVVSPISKVGGCSRISFTYRSHVVGGVPKGDNLNVRSAPSVNGRILTTVPELGLLWTTGKRSNGWAAVAVVVFRNAESGPAEIVEGWVNARFLSST